MGEGAAPRPTAGTIPLSTTLCGRAGGDWDRQFLLPNLELSHRRTHEAKALWQGLGIRQKKASPARSEKKAVANLPPPAAANTYVRSPCSLGGATTRGRIDPEKNTHTTAEGRGSPNPHKDAEMNTLEGGTDITLCCQQPPTDRPRGGPWALPAAGPHAVRPAGHPAGPGPAQRLRRQRGPGAVVGGGRFFSVPIVLGA